MNLFEEAKLKNKIKNLPNKYEPFKKVIHKGVPTIYVKNIFSVFISDEEYKINDFIFEDDFKIFVYDNFYKLTKLETFNLGIRKTFLLEDGFLHCDTDAALKTTDDISGSFKYYFINGREIMEEEFKQIIREKKLERITKATL